MRVRVSVRDYIQSGGVACEWTCVSHSCAHTIPARLRRKFAQRLQGVSNSSELVPEHGGFRGGHEVANVLDAVQQTPLDALEGRVGEEGRLVFFAVFALVEGQLEKYIQHVLEHEQMHF